MKCGTVSAEPNVDHIYAKSRVSEWQLKLSNLQILCEECNRAKSASNYDYRPWLSQYLNEEEAKIYSPFTESEFYDVVLSNNATDCELTLLLNDLCDARCYVGWICSNNDYLIHAYIYNMERNTRKNILTQYRNICNMRKSDFERLLKWHEINICTYFNLDKLFYNEIKEKLGEISNTALAYAIVRSRFEHLKKEYYVEG